MCLHLILKEPFLYHYIKVIDNVTFVFSFSVLYSDCGHNLGTIENIH